jgi:class 3 adenylate cyclase/predicted ATPase
MSEIRNWLESIGLGQYGDAFEANEIDMDLLGQVDDQILKDIGVSAAGHRLRIRNAIAKLAAAPAAEVNVSTITPKHETPAASAERRQLTVMFCDLVGSTALSGKLDPEEMREVIRAYQDACSGPVARYDGFIAKFMGDGVLAYFGFPRAHEDDAERAVTAGLDIVTAVERLRAPEPLKVRLGIATGLVVVGDLVGEGASQEQAVVGDTPNLAARLQALAEPGTIVVAASTRRLLGDLFKMRNLGRHDLKGFAEPVHAWAVEGLLGSESRFEAMHAARLTSFVGREDEIALLLDRKNLAWQGEGQIVLVSGEPGIGKSRIAAALGACIASEPHTRLRFQCSSHHGDSALYPFIAQLERATESHPDDSPERRLDRLEAVLAMGTSRVQAVAPLVAALLSIPFAGRYPPLALSPAQQRRQTLAALLDQFEGLARKQPILLLFEDVHWADPTSIELLDLTVERIRHLPVLAIFTFRPEFEPPWAGLPNVTTLALGRLNQSYVQTMAEQVAGGRRLPAEVMGQIITKTDGIPLFVEELTKAVLEAGILVEHTEGYRLEGPLPPLAIPATLHDSLMARLDRLAPVKEIAQVGAAVGREFSYALLLAVTGRDQASLNAALLQLEEAELLFRTRAPHDARYSFKHALVQDAAYESLLKSRRQVLHQRIAEALRDRFAALADAEPEIVAHHFTQAGLTEAAVEWWGKAGDLALHRSAYNEAIADLEKGLDIARGLMDLAAHRLLRLRLQITLGYALLNGRGVTSPETSAAFVRARELAAEVEDTSERFAAYWGLFMGSYLRAELTAMRDVASASLSDAERLPGSLESSIAHGQVGITRWFEGNYVEARLHLRKSVAGFDREPERERYLASRIGENPGIRYKAFLARVLWPLGEVDQASRLDEEALRLARQAGHVASIAGAYSVTCLNAVMRGKPDHAAPHAEALVRLACEHGFPTWLASGKAYLGWSRRCAGDQNGEELMREGLELLHDLDIRLLLPLFRVEFIQGETEGVEVALAALDCQLAEANRSGQAWFDAELHRLRGEVLLRRRPPDAAAAETAFMCAIEIARSQQTRSFELRTALSLAKLYQATGRGEAARQLLRPALAGFTEGPELPEVAEANRLLTSLEQTFGAA